MKQGDMTKQYCRRHDYTLCICIFTQWCLCWRWRIHMSPCLEHHRITGDYERTVLLHTRIDMSLQDRQVRWPGRHRNKTVRREGLHYIYFSLKRKLWTTRHGVIDDTALLLDNPTDSAVGGRKATKKCRAHIFQIEKSRMMITWREPQRGSKVVVEKDQNKQRSRQLTSMAGKDMEPEVQNERRFSDKKRQPP